MDEILAAVEAINSDYGATPAPPRRSRASTSRTTWCSAACSATSARSSRSGRGYPVQQPRHGSVPAGPRHHARLAPPHPPAAGDGGGDRSAAPCRSGTCIPGRALPASIVIVTHDNLLFTRMCLESVLACTEYPDYELIVVDNGSRDGTPEYLHELAAANPHVRLVLNPDNAGFARACNQGLALARGDVLVLLNDDTLVPPGWLPRLIAPAGRPATSASSARSPTGSATRPRSRPSTRPGARCSSSPAQRAARTRRVRCSTSRR